MALLDDILNRNKGKGGQSFYPTNEEELQEQAETTPAVVAPTQQTASTQDNVQSAKSDAQPEVKYAKKPQGLSDSDYEHLLRYNTEEQISKVHAPYDPSSNGSFLQRIYESTVPVPKAPDEKKLRNARTLAGIGDSVGLLSQMLSAGMGAHVKERDYNQSALAQVEGRERELTNLYMKQADKYNDGLYNAKLKDFIKGLEDYNNGRKGMQTVLAQKQALDQKGRELEEKQQNFDVKLAFDMDKSEKDRAFKANDQEERQRHNKSMEAQGWARIQDAKDRTTAYVRNINIGGGKNGYQMIFEANPSDKEVQQDSFGNNVKVFDMSKGQIDQYARQALEDTQFMDRHPELVLVLQKPDMFGAGTTKYKPTQDIAAAYLQEQYDNQYTSDGASPAPANYQYPRMSDKETQDLIKGIDQDIANQGDSINVYVPEEELSSAMGVDEDDELSSAMGVDEDDEFPIIGL